MLRQYIRRNIPSVSIILFIILFCLVQLVKPAFLYENDGSLRQFGLGTRKKTILPIWFCTLLLAIFSYLFVLYYLTMPKFSY